MEFDFAALGGKPPTRRERKAAGRGSPRPPREEDPARRWTVPQLQDELGCDKEGLRWLQKLGIIGPPGRVNRRAAYSDPDRVRALAALRLKRDGIAFRLAASRLASATWAQVREWAGLQLTPAQAQAQGQPPSLSTAAAPAPSAPRRPGALWSRLELEPGIELHVNLGAAPDAARLAKLLATLGLTAR